MTSREITKALGGKWHGWYGTAPMPSRKAAAKRNRGGRALSFPTPRNDCAPGRTKTEGALDFMNRTTDLNNVQIYSISVDFKSR